MTEEPTLAYQFRSAKGNLVEPPVLASGARIADTHCHLNMLKERAVAIAHAACCGVDLLVDVTDVTDDAAMSYANIDEWFAQAADLLLYTEVEIPAYRLAVGIHPHNARSYTFEIEERLLSFLHDPRTVVLGEIGLDYHYDLSPRAMQRAVFERQLDIARDENIPVTLHIREAHEDALAILREAALPEGHVLIHCYNLDYATLVPFLELGCSVAFGGPVTFKSGDDAREAAAAVPVDRLMTETDAPFMAPVPLRGAECTPAHTVFTAAKLCEIRGLIIPDERQYEFLEQLRTNAATFFGV